MIGLIALAFTPALVCVALALSTGVATFWVAAAIWAVSGPLFFA
jgi:hypothetical protein